MLVSSFPGMITVASVTVVEGKFPVRTPETVTDSSPSATASALTVRSKVVVPLEFPAAILMAAGAVAVKSPVAPSVAWPGPVPPATATAMVTPPIGAVVSPARWAVTVTVRVLSAAVSSTVAGLTDRVAASGRVTGSTMVSCTGLTSSPAARPERVKVSDPSVSVSP